MRLVAAGKRVNSAGDVPVDSGACRNGSPTGRPVAADEEVAMNRIGVLTATTLAAFIGVAHLAGAYGQESAGASSVAAMLPKAKVSLDRGIAASEKTGKPISAKYEIDEGRFQLSVYTMKDDRFYQVIVDHETGKIAGTEAIAAGDDLKDARTQSEATAKAKRPLRVVLRAVLKGQPGYLAVSIVPELKDRKPVATISLMKGEETKTVVERLN